MCCCCDIVDARAAVPLAVVSDAGGVKTKALQRSAYLNQRYLDQRSRANSGVEVCQW